MNVGTGSFNVHTSEVILNLTATGNITFGMRMYGYTPDIYGVHISYVSLAKLTAIPSTSNSTNTTSNTTTNTTTNITTNTST